MKALEIKKGIYWVGAIDWDLRNFHGYLTQRGSTYNAYLIVDEKITLIDTVKHYLFDQMMARIQDVIDDPSRIDYIISNHTEMDHSGSLPQLMQVCPDATIITSPNGEKGLKRHYGQDWQFKVVQSGDTLNIGAQDCAFVLTQMVHWPDSMATYIPQQKLLVPNDAFGQHIASNERFDDELGSGLIFEEAAKYYANIVLPYGNQVKKALEEVAKLDIDMIAPSHGLIWRKHIQEIIAEYTKWANNETNEQALVIYDTMWESTHEMANALIQAFELAGIPAQPFLLQTNHISDVMTRILTAKYICIGSPTLNNGLMPSVAAFLCYLKGLAPKNRVGCAFGSYGWGGQATKEIHETLTHCGFQTIDPIRTQYIPRAEDLQQMSDAAQQMVTLAA